MSTEPKKYPNFMPNSIRKICVSHRLSLQILDVEEDKLWTVRQMSTEPRSLGGEEVEEVRSENVIDSKTSDFLMAVNLHQYKKPITEIYKLANLTAGTGSRIARRCEKDNLIKIVKVSFGPGRPRYPVLLERGYSVLGVTEKKFYGKGAGVEHVLYQHLVAEHFSDFEPEIELNRDGKFVDVGVLFEGKLVAVEVAMTAVNERINVEKDLERAKVAFVVIACRDEKVLQGVEKSISGLGLEVLNRVRVCLVGELLRCEPERFLKEVLG